MSISLRIPAIHSAVRRHSNPERANAGGHVRNASAVDTFERTGTARVLDENSEVEAVRKEVKIGAAIGVVGAIGMGALFFISPLAAAIASVGLLVATIAYARFSN